MRDKIINESIDLFDTKGFKETSIQDIVDNIGVTKGTFYYYFKSKQELLKDIHLSFIVDLLKRQEEIIGDSNKNNYDKLYDIIYLIISRIKTHGKSARITFREMRHVEEQHLVEIKRKREEFRLNLEKLLKEGITKGEFRNKVEPDILSFAILGMVNRSYFWYNPDGELSEEELVKSYNEILLNGLKNEEPYTQGILH
ncbi:TetR/AcrR family transcriptional regulator [Oceanobacillus bengalensis]|uniref:TetR/AcrR family transcriptional regulator n=1 Tax=Oceanobacillus bengalensis TaxID=1435466 RepID=A0A494Z2B1_9BACI|nr:TetR/AcrR family transcriptional regulator [Oceanobacillus bengalensis]RKQ16623.1 TetR/AcrR family transcriptional regulator [Oceanobacillus bengalensis]